MLVQNTGESRHTRKRAHTHTPIHTYIHMWVIVVVILIVIEENFNRPVKCQSEQELKGKEVKVHLWSL